ncbi:MAG: motility protein A [Deltaproteobacteria bacterium]|nr:motility protein A [Deltaproteobacteria bacterium]
MDLATLIGIVSAFALVMLSIMMGSGLGIFIDVPSAMIVAGGTLGATMIHYPLKDVLSVFRVMKNVFFTKAWSGQEVIDLFVDFSRKARREGLLSLERYLDELDDGFLRRGLQLAVDGMEPEAIREILETEIDYQQERHRAGAEILNTMANFFPAMGMIGTLIGLIQMLRTMEDPSTIGPAMALALVTTFYGALASNFICLPMSGKLRKRSQEETLIKEMVVAGILSLTNGENPRIVEQKLHAFMPPRSRSSHFQAHAL